MYELTLESLYRLTSGKIPWITLGTLEPGIANAIGTPHARHVLFSLETYEHVMREHPHLSDDELLLMPHALKNGLAVIDPARPQWVTFSYRDRGDNGPRYLLAVKGAAHGHNVHARSWRRMTQRQLRVNLKRGEILRQHR